jgi:hypothetical protein
MEEKEKIELITELEKVLELLNINLAVLKKNPASLIIRENAMSNKYDFLYYSDYIAEIVKLKPKVKSNLINKPKIKDKEDKVRLLNTYLETNKLADGIGYYWPKEIDLMCYCDYFIEELPLCKLLQVSRQTIINWNSLGYIKSYKIQHRTKSYSLISIISFLRSKNQ